METTVSTAEEHERDVTEKLSAFIEDLIDFCAAELLIDVGALRREVQSNGDEEMMMHTLSIDFHGKQLRDRLDRRHPDQEQ